MRLLAVETSGPIGSVCICEDDRAPLIRQFGAARQHASELLPSLDELFRQAGWNPRSDLDLVAISIGPGSYTGLRVGLACVKTLAWAAGCAVVGIPSLDVIAQNALDASISKSFDHAAVAVDAKRGQVYSGIYELIDGIFALKGEIELLAAEDFAEKLDMPCLLFGDGVRSYRNRFEKENVHFAPEELWAGRALTVAKLGLQAWNGGRRDDPATLSPIYMRRPEAEEKRLKKLQGK